VLENKVVVITGSGQGIGKHAAKTFAQEKAKVVIADFNADLAKKSAAELSALTETLAVHADVREEESVKKLIDQVISRFGQIDALINNAAIVPHFAWNIPRWPLIADMPVEFWDRVIHTNLYGTFFGTKHVIPHMAKRKSGHIINLYGGGGRRLPRSFAHAQSQTLPVGRRLAQRAKIYGAAESQDRRAQGGRVS